MEDEVSDIVEGIEKRVLVSVEAELFFHARYVCVLDVGRVEPFEED